jgi:hypothetical protein
MSDTAAAVIERDEKSGRFVTGNSGGGRPVGSRNKLTTMYMENLRLAWEQHGAEVIERIVRDDPMGFARLIGSLMPRDVHLSVGVESFVVRAPAVTGDSRAWQAATGASQIDLEPVAPDTEETGNVIELPERS